MCGKQAHSHNPLPLGVTPVRTASFHNGLKSVSRAFESTSDMPRAATSVDSSPASSAPSSGNTSPEDSPSPPPQPRKKLTKNEFRHRPSHLDPSTRESLIEQSEFRGFFNLFGIFLFYFFVTTQARNILYEGDSHLRCPPSCSEPPTGTLVGLKTAWRFFTGFEVVPVWLAYVGISFIAPIMQILLVKGYLPELAHRVLHAVFEVSTPTMRLHMRRVAFC